MSRLGQRNPSAVDRDSLRNAANMFVYVNPLTLPATGPATQLTRAPHNFSRVFTGAFLEGLGGMVTRLSARPGMDAVQEADRAVAKGRQLAEQLKVDAWLTEDNRHFLRIATFRP